MVIAIYPYTTNTAPISNFEYVDWLVLGRSPTTLKRDDREAMYIVMEDYRVILTIGEKTHVIVVPRGMTTDFASIPRWARSIIGRVGPHLEACIVHDWLYIAWQLQDRMPTRQDHNFANRVLYAGIKSAKCSWVTRVGIWIAMEFPFLSWNVFKGRDKNLFIELDKED